MRFKSILASTSLTLLVAFSTPGFADGNIVTLQQYGLDNGLGASQSGYLNRLSVNQNGWSPAQTRFVQSSYAVESPLVRRRFARPTR